MFNFNKFLVFDSQNTYENSYSLSIKKIYSNSKIYDANGDLSIRWYVYFLCQNPETGKLKWNTPFYGKAINTKQSRIGCLF